MKQNEMNPKQARPCLVKAVKHPQNANATLYDGKEYIVESWVNNENNNRIQLQRSKAEE